MEIVTNIIAQRCFMKIWNKGGT